MYTAVNFQSNTVVFFSALGLAFVPLGYNGLRIHTIKFSFNMYTGPGYLSAVLGVVNIVLLIVFFREFKLTKSSESEKMSKAVNYGTITGDRKMNKFLRGEEELAML